MKEILDWIDIADYDADGYARYRAPGLVTAPNGDILLYCEARAEDANRRSLLCRRSTDGGTHFEPAYPLKTDDGTAMLHNPLMISDVAGGKLYFFWNEDYRRLYCRESTDSGATWGPVRELTAEVMAWQPDYPVAQFAVAPGHGLTLRDGTLLLPLWMSRSPTAHAPAVFATLSSTDGGATWQRSNVVGSTEEVLDPTEGSVAQLRDGSLLATLRHGAQESRCRAFVRGTPQSWGQATLNRTLPDPICAGSVLALRDGSIFFTNCAYGDEPCLARRAAGEDIRWSRDARQQLTVRRSTDDGHTFGAGSLLSFEGGYSDLACSADEKWIYCFYERGWIEGDSIQNAHLAFARFTPDWVR